MWKTYKKYSFDFSEKNLQLTFKMENMVYRVTLKTRKRRTHRSTETPSESSMYLLRAISAMLPNTTKQSNLLNIDTK